MAADEVTTFPVPRGPGAVPSPYQRSLWLLDRARNVTPGGSQTVSKAATSFVEGAYPVFLDAGHRAHVWDVDEHEYIDWICALGAVGLGYCNEGVNLAVQRQLAAGVSFSLPHPLEAEVAAQLVEVIPCAEQVRFVKTGSEATEAAVRVARIATGRSVVLTCGYHGWHSWSAATQETHPGVPEELTHLVRTFRYNDLASLDELIGSEVAAIILEATCYEPPVPGFLEGVRARATRLGAVLIFDEIVTGFRWALGGGQEFFRVTPDLATFGKALANGLPLACLAGRRDLMEHATVVSGTFSGETLSLAAAGAVLYQYRAGDVIPHLWKIGTELQTRFNVVAQITGDLFACVGYGVKPKIIARSGHGREADRALLSLLCQELAGRGILIHPGGLNVCAAHTQTDVVQTIQACDVALRVCREADRDDHVTERLRGTPYQGAPWAVNLG